MDNQTLPVTQPIPETTYTYIEARRKGLLAFRYPYNQPHHYEPKKATLEVLRRYHFNPFKLSLMDIVEYNKRILTYNTKKETEHKHISSIFDIKIPRHYKINKPKTYLNAYDIVAQSLLLNPQTNTPYTSVPVVTNIITKNSELRDTFGTHVLPIIHTNFINHHNKKVTDFYNRKNTPDPTPPPIVSSTLPQFSSHTTPHTFSQYTLPNYPSPKLST